MKRPLLSIVLFLSLVSAKGQSWSSLGSGIYYGGRLGSIYAMTLFNKDIVAAGQFDSAGNTAANNIAIWSGINWMPMGTGVNATITTLCVYNGQVYAGGYFDAAGGMHVNCIAKWNGKIWSAVGAGVTGGSFGADIEAMIVYNGNLFIGGHFDSVGGFPAKNIAKWNGSNWDSVPGDVGKKISYGSVSSFLVYNGNLIVGGTFTDAGGVSTNNIAQWNGSNWSVIGVGMGANDQVVAMANYNSNLIIGGGFDSINGVKTNYVAQWNGTNWSPMGNGMDNIVYSLGIYNSELYAGGAFYHAGANPVNRISKWNGVNWTSVGTGVQGYDSLGVDCMITFDSVLYIGGEFYNAGGIPSYDIAQWEEPLGINELIESNSVVLVYPNPSNSIFTFQMQGINQKSQIEIYNMLGEKIYTSMLNNTTTQVDLCSNPNGIYLYRITSQDGQLLGTGKLIKE